MFITLVIYGSLAAIASALAKLVTIKALAIALMGVAVYFYMPVVTTAVAAINPDLGIMLAPPAVIVSMMAALVAIVGFITAGFQFFFGSTDDMLAMDAA